MEVGEVIGGGRGCDSVSIRLWLICSVARGLKVNMGKYPGRGLLADAGGYKRSDRVIF
jgi:hypothetical protein